MMKLALVGLVAGSLHFACGRTVTEESGGGGAGLSTITLSGLPKHEDFGANKDLIEEINIRIKKADACPKPHLVDHFFAYKAVEAAAKPIQVQVDNGCTIEVLGAFVGHENKGTPQHIIHEYYRVIVPALVPGERLRGGTFGPITAAFSATLLGLSKQMPAVLASSVGVPIPDKKPEQPGQPAPPGGGLVSKEIDLPVEMWDPAGGDQEKRIAGNLHAQFKGTEKVIGIKFGQEFCGACKSMARDLGKDEELAQMKASADCAFVSIVDTAANITFWAKLAKGSSASSAEIQQAAKTIFRAKDWDAAFGKFAPGTSGIPAIAVYNARTGKRMGISHGISSFKKACKNPPQ